MEKPDDVLEIASLGQRYLDNKLAQHQIQGEFDLSNRGDIPDMELIDDQQRERLAELALGQLDGKVVFGVLAAGASSRMDPQQMPDDVAQLLKDSGRSEMPISKALVPVTRVEGRVMNFLDLFLANVERFSQQTNTSNPALIFVSEANEDEIVDHVKQHWGDLFERVIFFVQPLAPQIVAKESDVEKFSENFPPDVAIDDVKAFSREFAGHDLKQGKPAGHGEFLHQIVASGTLSRLLDTDVTYLAVRNIDNVAAVYDRQWLTVLGHAFDQELDCLVEVSPRPENQKGGALIRKGGAWRIAEDPSFAGTGHSASESYYMNNAVALFRLEYMLKLYETTDDQIRALADPKDARSRDELGQIADQGRRRFPTIVEAKPLTISTGQTIAAVTPETNMWESTGVVEGAKIGAFGVRSERAAGDDYQQQDAEQQQRLANQIRFSPTKTWRDYQDATKQAINHYIAQQITDGQLV